MMAAAVEQAVAHGPELCKLPLVKALAAAMPALEEPLRPTIGHGIEPKPESDPGDTPAAERY
jgi:hypothetical protein